MKMEQISTKVAIAGAGPVGAVAAYLLACQGIDVVLLEAGRDCALDLRASTFHPPTLEMLDQFGITEKLIEMGLKAPVYHFRERQTGEVIDFDLSELADVTRYPFRVQCEQYHLARMLSEGVRQLPGAQVLFNHRVLSFEQDADAVTVYAETPTSIVSIKADFLVAADGASSIVRKWLGMEFDGFTYPEKFLCYTTKEPLEDHFSNLAYVNYVSDPKEWMVLLRVPSLWRVLVPAAPEADDAMLLADANKIDVFDRLLGEGDGSRGEQVKTEHRTIYRVHQRVAKSFRQNRVVLIGDAAHLNNPIGGFGMNSGIHDAFKLGEKLASIYHHGADADTAIAEYDRERRRITHEFTQAQTIRNLQYLAAGEGEEHALRKREMEGIRANPVKRREFLLRQSMIECLAREKEAA